MTEPVARPVGRQNVLKLAGVILQDDETMVSSIQVHGAIYWKGVALAILGILLIPTFAANLGYLLIFFGIVMIGMAHLTRTFLILAATTKRIFVRSGIFYADMIELRYSQIESIELGITPIGQMFGYANVIVTGTGQRRINVPFVANAISFRNKVNEILVNK